MTEVSLPYGASRARLVLPDGATVERMGPGRAAEGAPSTLEAVLERALASPHDAPPLEVSARAERAATIAVSPGMPAAWAAVVLRVVAARLARGGMPASSVRVHIAREPYGAPGPASLEAHLRTSRPGLWVHRVGTPEDVAPGAGLLVLVGFAHPHPIAGWTGGSDLCTPGLLSEDGARTALRSTLDARVGPDGTPRSLRGSRSGLGFAAPASDSGSTRPIALAVVLGRDAGGAPVAAAGALRTTHDAVVRAIAPGRAPAAPSPADVVVLGGGAPSDRDLPAASQALDLALALARPGTIVVWLAEAAEGPGPPSFLQWFEAGRLERHLAALRREFQPEGLVAYSIRAAAARVPIYVVSREGVDLLRPMGLTPFADVQTAFDRAWGGRASGRVVVVPCPAAVSFG